MTSQEKYETVEGVMNRLSELVAYQRNRQSYQTRTELLIAMVKQIEAEGHSPTPAMAMGFIDRPVEIAEILTCRGFHYFTP